MKKHSTNRLLPPIPKRGSADKPIIFRRLALWGDLSLLRLAIFEAAAAILFINLWRLTRVHPWLLLTLWALMQSAVWYFSKRSRKKTKDLVQWQLPQALDIISRVYRVHPNLKAAVAQVPLNLQPGPTSTLFAQVHSLASFGYSVEEALDKVNIPLGSEDLAQVATSLRIHIRQGGDIASQLGHMANLLRRRREVTSEVGAAMFQNKISSVFTSLFVPLIIILVFTINTDGYRQILTNPAGRTIFLVALGWWALGIVIMRRLMRVAI